MQFPLYYNWKNQEALNFPDIPEPQSKNCKLAVVVPVYNELTDNLLCLLGSFSSQTASSELYEIIFVVNNFKNQAAQQTPEFLQNQIILRLLNSFGRQPSDSNFLSSGQKAEWKKIKSSGVVIHAVDKSSFANAEIQNNVGKARHIGGEAALKRFLANGNKQGIIALTDCDCEVSKNYISSITESFKKYKINGISGKLIFEFDKKLPYSKIVEQGFELYLETKLLTTKHASYPKIIWYQKADNFPYPLLVTGQNMAVSLKAWQSVRGIPHASCREDVLFGHAVCNLPGEVIKNSHYSVRAKGRSSDRVGITGAGRVIGKIAQSVADYCSGKSQSVDIPNKKLILGFFNNIYSQSPPLGQNSTQYLEKVFEECGLNFGALSLMQRFEINELYRKYLQQPAPVTQSALDQWILDNLYEFLPSLDITGQLEL